MDNDPSTYFSPARLFKAVVISYVGVLIFGFLFGEVIGESINWEWFYLFVPIMLAFQFPIAALIVVFIAYCGVGAYDYEMWKKRRND